MRFFPLHLSPKILIFNLYTLDNIHRPMKALSHIKFGVRVWAYDNGEEIILNRWKVLNVAQKSHNNIFLEYLDH